MCLMRVGFVDSFHVSDGFSCVIMCLGGWVALSYCVGGLLCENTYGIDFWSLGRQDCVV